MRRLIIVLIAGAAGAAVARYRQHRLARSELELGLADEDDGEARS